MLSREDAANEDKFIDKDKAINFFSTIRFASKWDWILMIFGFIAAIRKGPYSLMYPVGYRSSYTAS